jgi:DNA-binding HxlR family transcriptional regulator
MNAIQPRGAGPIEASFFVRAALQVLAGKWTLPILWLLGQGPQRYGDLVRDGLVEREELPTRPPQVSYCFSAWG